MGNLDLDASWFHSRSSYCTDLISLCLLRQIVKPKVVFGIGTLRGYTAYHSAPNTGSDSRIFTLDLLKHKPQNPMLSTTVVDRAGLQPQHVTRLLF